MRGAGSRPVPFDAAWLVRRLEALNVPIGTPGTRLVVAWSGGADSTALLAALCEVRDGCGRTARPAVRAVHVDHGLQADSRLWARHCRKLARALRVPLAVRRIEVPRKRGVSPEAAARDARYAALQAQLRPGEVLLLAQHARDQLETLLLQLMRGSGARGLAAMSERRRLGDWWLLRPLLDTAPEDLRSYLRARGLAWVEDPSNVKLDVDRNYLRAEVVPRLLERWPGALRTGGRSASLLRAANAQVGAAAQRDLARVTDGHALNLPLLRRIPLARIGEVLRAWLDREGAPLPDQARLAQIVTVLHLRGDAQPAVHWSGVELRRHRDRLIVTAMRTARQEQESPVPWQWSARTSLQLRGGCLRIAVDPHGDVDLARLPRPLFVSGRPNGRDSRAGGGGVDVKSLLRESEVPSWRRNEVPFLYATGDDSAVTGLLAIADLWLAPGVRATPDSLRRGRIVWRES